MKNKYEKNTKFILKKISSEDTQMTKRLRDLGFHDGVSVLILNIISFNSVYVLQINQSIIALNETEMSCLIY